MVTAAAAFWLTSAAHAGGKGSGRADVKEITVTKQTDVSTQTLMRKSNTGSRAPTITHRKAGKGQY